MTGIVPAWQATLDAETPPPSLRRLVRASVATVALGFGGFFLWAATAPLDSAVPANGTIVVQGKRKTVTLLDSGIMKELLVGEGSRVAAGQMLLRLDETQAQVQVAALAVQRWAAVSRVARLRAELQDRRELELPAELLDAAAADPAVDGVAANERRLFADRWRTFDNTLAVQRKRVAQFTEQIAALKAQSEAAAIRLRNAEQQLAGVRQLVPKGFAPRDKALDLEARQAELKGMLGEYLARAAEARENIAQAELELARLQASWHADLAKELQEAQTQAADLGERLRGAEDVLSHKGVTAPEAGVVTDIRFFTPGSSIVAGQPVLDLVPLDNRMLVEVPVSPNDVEHVHPGQKVNIRLTSYKQHKVPVLTGRLVYVSADRQTDQKGEPFFVARAEIDPEALAGLKGVKLYPGMPAETLIIGGERTALDYFLSPIADSVHRALREE